MPTVINRHRYLPTDGAGPRPAERTGRERRPPLPDPWVYVGRGSALGNPFPRHLHPGEDVEGRPLAIALYRRWLWRKVQAGDAAVWAMLRQIGPDTHLVCSCAPRPCHADEIAKLWAWLRARGEV